MYKATVLYGQPDDPAEFDRYYEAVHIGIASKMRGLSGWTISKIDPDAAGERPPYYLIAELYAPSREALLAIFDSPEGRASSEDVKKFASGGATFLLGDIRTVIPVPEQS
jgi:uncharacterized protein (TIGR02118 family)